MAKTKAKKKAGRVTRKKRIRKRERKAKLFQDPGPILSEEEQQRQTQRHREWKAGFEESWRRRFGSKRAILYLGKLAHIWATPRGTAKWLAEELRADPPHGARLLAGEVEWHWGMKGFVPEMLKALNEYLENDEQPVFKPMDDAIADILEKHPRYTIKKITSELAKQYPNQWDALEKRVRRFLKNVPFLPKEPGDPDEDWLGGY